MFWKNPIWDNKYLEAFRGGYYFYLHIDQKTESAREQKMEGRN